MEHLIHQLNSLKTASPEAVSQLEKLFIKTTFNAGASLNGNPFRDGHVLHYIHGGLTKGTLKHHGHTYTLWLMESGFLLPTSCFLTQHDLVEDIGFLKESTVYSLDLYTAEEFAQQNISLYKMLLEIYELCMSNWRKRELMLRIKGCEERVDYAEHLDKNLMYCTDRNTVASYLNVTVRHLNRIKGGK